MPSDPKGLYHEFLREYQTMALATAGKDGIVDCAMVYFAVDDDDTLFFVSDGNAQKVKNLSENQRAAATCHKDGTPRAVQVRGLVEKVTDAVGKEKIKKLLLESIPPIKKYFDNPRLQFFKFVADERFLINFNWGVDFRVKV